MARIQSAPRELFLSHSHVDRRFAFRLAEDIRRHGVPVWFSGTNILGAQQWHDEIGRALARCDWFAVILSKSSVRSPWVQRELVYALNEPRYGKHIVPIRYRSCDPSKLSWTIGSFQAVDLTGDYVEGCCELLRTWGLAYSEAR